MTEIETSADDIVATARQADAEALDALEQQGQTNAADLANFSRENKEVLPNRRTLILGILGGIGLGVAGNTVYDLGKKALDWVLPNDMERNALVATVRHIGNILAGADSRTLPQLRVSLSDKNAADAFDLPLKLTDVFIQRSSGLASHHDLDILRESLTLLENPRDHALLCLHRARVRAFVENDSSIPDDIKFAVENGDDYVAAAAILEQINYAQLMVHPERFDQTANWYPYALSFKQLSQRDGHDYAFEDIDASAERKQIERQAVVSRYPGIGAHVGFFAGQYEVMMSLGAKREAAWERTTSFLNYMSGINIRLAFNHAVALAFMAAQLGEASRTRQFITAANKIAAVATTGRSLSQSGISLAQFGLFKIFEARFLFNVKRPGEARTALLQAATLEKQVGHPAFHAALNRADNVVGARGQPAGVNQVTLAHARGGFSTMHTWSYIYFPGSDIA